MNEAQPRDALRRHVLVVDDERDIGEFVAIAAEMNGFDCTVTTTAQDFLAALGRGRGVSIIMLDLVMPDFDGIELLRHLQGVGCKAPIVLMSGFDKRVLRTAEELANELGLHVLGRLQKPFRLGQLCELFEISESFLGAADELPRPRETVVVSESDLDKAINDNAFVLHYQPQIGMRTREVTGIEALVRWQSPGKGLIYPDTFIALAESTGMIERLTWLIVQHAFEDRRQYAGRFPNLSLSVNISAKSLIDLAFPDTLFKLAEHFEVPPKNLILEITESGLIVDLVRTLDVLTRLRVKGMRMSIDDFGTGYSMMKQLRRVPATELKIDKGFVHEMQTDDGACTVVRKTIEIGHEMGMEVVAEGIETAEQLAFLEGLDCDIGQGYYFSRPLPLRALLGWLDDWRCRP